MCGPDGPSWRPSGEDEYEGDESVEAILGQIDDRAKHCREAIDDLPLGFRMTVLTAALNDTLEGASASEYLVVASRSLTLAHEFVNSAYEVGGEEFDEEFKERLDDIGGLCFKFAEELEEAGTEESFDEWGERMNEEMTELLDSEDFDPDESSDSPS